MTAALAEALYRRFGPSIYHRAKRMLGDRTAAEDATQDVFVKSFAHLDKLADDRDAIRWLNRVTTNHCLNLLRNAKRQATPMASVPEVGVDPEQALLDKHVVRSLLSQVPESLGEPAALHYLAGYDQGKVAALLGVSRRTVINRLQKFQAHALRLLQPQRDEP